MSGGYFYEGPYVIKRMKHDIQKIIDENDVTPTAKFWKYEGNQFPPEIIKRLNEAIKYLQLSYIYTQRIDYLMSGFDGEDTFLKKLKEDLKEE